MTSYLYKELRLTIILFFLLAFFNSVVEAKEIKLSKYLGHTKIIGSVVSSPCSIVMKDRYQTIDFSSLTMTELSTALEREQHNLPFEIELRDCGSIYSAVDKKTWFVRFEGNTAENINAFTLKGASQGLGVSVLDNKLNILVPGQLYPLIKNVLYDDTKHGQSLFLRYFLRLELTGKPLQAGNYQGLIRFFIDYQ
ncbi:fimbrial protein [Providencia sneebia]|uniref:Fimbrial subunit n=1 Tax=Providencia sneebia DSM 19967 TaxID=1141660 RepID=K8WJB9_9GAMM|nr:fimbrial protein [Providencia sneebia]EKT57572.1 fimbrial subunit [Providencia sneebia DSM 19967]